MSVYDARVGAWAMAWDHLEAAKRLQEKYPDRQTGEEVGRLHQAAGIYAQLAVAPESVGFLAGSVLEERRDRERDDARARDRIADALAKFDAGSTQGVSV